MNSEAIRKFCLSFPHATENLQWGDDLCFKIGGKIFVTLSLSSVPQKICFKCSPESFTDLCEREDIHHDAVTIAACPAAGKTGSGPWQPCGRAATISADASPPRP